MPHPPNTSPRKLRDDRQPGAKVYRMNGLGLAQSIENASRPYAATMELTATVGRLRGVLIDDLVMAH